MVEFVVRMEAGAGREEEPRYLHARVWALVAGAWIPFPVSSVAMSPRVSGGRIAAAWRDYRTRASKQAVMGRRDSPMYAAHKSSLEERHRRAREERISVREADVAIPWAGCRQRSDTGAYRPTVCTAPGIRQREHAVV